MGAMSATTLPACSSHADHEDETHKAAEEKRKKNLRRGVSEREQETPLPPATLHAWEPGQATRQISQLLPCSTDNSFICEMKEAALPDGGRQRQSASALSDRSAAARW
eukprot:693751-Hanusia_phi.AAC.2